MKLTDTHKIILVIVGIVALGFLFPPDNPITLQIINSITNSIIVSVAQDLGPEAVECIEDLGGSYNFQTLECDV